MLSVASEYGVERGAAVMVLKENDVSGDALIFRGMSSAEAELLSEMVSALERFGPVDRTALAGRLAYHGFGARVADELCALGDRLINFIWSSGGLVAADNRGLVELCVRVYSRAVEVDSLCWRGYRQLSVLLLALGRPSDAAVNCYVWSAKARGDEVERRVGLFMLGMSHVFIDSFEAAVSTFDQALGEYIGSDEMHFGLAIAYIKMGERELVADEVRWLDVCGNPLARVVEKLGERPDFTIEVLFELLRELVIRGGGAAAGTKGSLCLVGGIDKPEGER